VNASATHYIAGRWTDDATVAVSVNPARPSDEVLAYPEADAESVDRAVTAAQEALRGWSSTPAPTRGRVLRRAAELLERDRDRLALLLTRDVGKTLGESQAEIGRAVETLYFHSAQAWAATGEQFASSKPDEIVRTVRRPLGTVGLITPFNFPLAITSWKLAPALVHGNTVVWKPAEAAPATAVELVRILEEAGLPAGVLNLVQGSAATGRAIVDHPGIAGITFTGSVPVGKSIGAAAEARGARYQGELGGHNVAIVFPDADLERAAREIGAGAMLGAGQKCTSTRRLVVDDAVADELTERLMRVVQAFRVGDGQEAGVDIGPVISDASRERIRSAVGEAKRQGAVVVTGDGDTPVADEGYFVAPTVLDGVAPRMTIAQEEVFGPVVSILRVGDDDEAFAVANDTRFGLSASIFTSSEGRLRQAIEQLDVGVLHVNNQTTGAEPHVPFGARRESASATAPPEQGQTARDFFTTIKTVYHEL